MKKLNYNKNYMQISIFIAFVLCFVLIFEKTISNLDMILQKIGSLSFLLKNILSPFIFGFFMAYLLNCPLKFIENKVLINFKIFKNNKSLLRIVSIIVTFLFSNSFLFFIVAIVMPELTKSIEPLTKTIVITLPKYSYYIEDYLNQIFIENSYISSTINHINIFLNKNISINQLVDYFMNNFNTTMISSKLYETLLSFTTAIPNLIGYIVKFAFNFLLGTMIAFYVLKDKEFFSSQSKKILTVIFKKNFSEKIIDICLQANQIFEKFIVGKTIDSLIIGFLFFIGGLFLNLPFLPLLSLIIAITNIVPYFGPIIGSVPVIFLVFLDCIVSSTDPIICVWLSLWILALQQFDGIILGPKILGDSTGLKPLGVIFSIIVGGGLFGFWGMLLGVPVFALFVILFNNFINKKYKNII